MSMNLRSAKMSDLDMVADCHRRCFPDTLSAKLGAPFVRKQMECFVADDDKFLLVIDEGGECGGYVNGILMDERTLGSASSMLQSAFSEGIKAVVTHPWLILHPEIRGKFGFIMKNVRRRILGQSSRPESQTSRPKGFKSAGLPGMCVHPNHRRKGYATELMLAAEQYAYDRGFRRLHCTVALTNSAATNCHKKLGYNIFSESQTSVVMVKEIVDKDARRNLSGNVI